MSRITTVSLATGLLGLVMSMTVALVAAFPTALIAVGYAMMFLGAIGSVVGSVLARSLAG
ncbi:hypothetical protein FGK63_04040 [Ruegeria sediminis]|uniref:Major facilitator superfamily (MFS) profile domain-containing protein n=1 Tax=Ruegeria sediminis TaxID=2583820 RepID=A0ABY2X5Z0_9RHOB|nr:hypothetical protein [Ruegeria sediminis]TMV10242.1 hypothetical protein FGK63_04040 [Ruegeria sediminis]